MSTDRKLVDTIKLPRFEDVQGTSPAEIEEHAPETLLNLYDYVLRGKKVDTINPTRICMHEDDIKEYLDKDVKRVAPLGHKWKTRLPLMWMNQGPSGSREVPKGHIQLYEGYYEELKQDKVTEEKQ